MTDKSKYSTQFFPAPSFQARWVTKTHIEKAPKWCSVDLRDGNQSLMIPMSLEEKLEFFKLLCDIGFKEIEVGFPAASETEYKFLRTLIKKKLIPNDVTVQVLTQSREHIIRKTFAALKGAKNAIVHLYNSTSVAQREQVFRGTKEEILKIATDGAILIKQMAEVSGIDCRFEYSPESFTGTEPEFALKVCNAVLDIWQPTPDKKAIINLPGTVELSAPHVFANQVEFMCDNLKYRDSVEVSLHSHNDRGCAIADTELGLLAGADRVEGTLFGNGERTGNADIVTLALNMYAQGIEPGLDFSDIPKIAEIYERVTRMQVSERQPYSGKLVFAAFSGSHQDAIAKGMKWRKKHSGETWSVPYLPIDPKDIGRVYETDVIRINSQSGKGGIGYLLEQNFGYSLPKPMREDVGYTIKAMSDSVHGELTPEQVLDVFTDEYLNVSAPIELVDYHFTRAEKIKVAASVIVNGQPHELTAEGNGRLDAFANALRGGLGISFSDLTYEEHALTKGSSAKAVTYLSIAYGDKRVWGVGIHDDIIASSINALVSAVNRAIR